MTEVEIVIAYGDSEAEVEGSAVEQARERFGDRLFGLVPSYPVRLVDWESPEERRHGKAYRADVTVLVS